MRAQELDGASGTSRYQPPLSRDVAPPSHGTSISHQQHDDTMSNATRADVYRRVHRGLRKALLDVTTLAGATVWTDRTEVARLQVAFLDLLSFLKSHGEREETFQLPLLESKMPGITAVDSEEHEAIEIAIEQVEAAFAAAIIAATDERRAAGERFFHRLCLFTGMYLHHMSHEETVTTEHFHRYCTDEEIHDAGRRLIASLTPEEISAAVRHMLPAMDAVDRLEYVRSVVAASPAPAAAALLALAEETLDSDEYARLLGELELAAL